MALQPRRDPPRPLLLSHRAPLRVHGPTGPVDDACLHPAAGIGVALIIFGIYVSAMDVKEMSDISMELYIIEAAAILAVFLLRHLIMKRRMKKASL